MKNNNLLEFITLVILCFAHFFIWIKVYNDCIQVRFTKIATLMLNSTTYYQVSINHALSLIFQMK